MKKGFLLDDRSLYETKFSPVCTYCKHWNVNAERPRTCAAFKDQIPDEIWEGKNDHTSPYKGDRGILFQKRQAP